MSQGNNHLYNCMLLFAVFFALPFHLCAQLKYREKKTEGEFQSAGIAFRFHHSVHHGEKVRYAISGADTLPTLIFVNVSPGEWKDYQAFMKDSEILKNFRVISIDRPGFGSSSNHRVYHLDAAVELIASTIAELNNGKKRIWIGHSLGGPFVVYMAMTHPELVDGLAILAGSISPQHEAPEKWRYILDLPQIKWILPKKFRTSNKEIAYFKKDIQLLDQNWSAISCPVLVVHGTKDPLVPYGNALYAMEQLRHNPHTRLDTIAGANHYLPWKYYSQIKTSLLTFF